MPDNNTSQADTGAEVIKHSMISDSYSSKLIGWSWAYAQYQPINMPESEIWEKFYNLGPRNV